MHFFNGAGKLELVARTASHSLRCSTHFVRELGRNIIFFSARVIVSYPIEMLLSLLLLFMYQINRMLLNRSTPASPGLPFTSYTFCVALLIFSHSR